MRPTTSISRRSKSGQSITEFAIMSGIIAVGGMVTLWAFGWFVMGIFSQLGQALKDETVDDSGSAAALVTIDSEASHRDNMDSFTDGVGQVE